MTGLTPEKRFENHKRGYKGNKYVERYGERLAMEDRRGAGVGDSQLGASV